ncbi:uncharacterized protein K452DRAFT_310771 [Aplosporella prunicola CBS 121167]|uniref:Asteroid domain-containing protein n=1 Tax=Aplosporella prunicola CBS 121167 TaxID=1176127 RepID=A0A6A6B5B4_9PEZI|nr:uncharacterized protein K452DRAFT_310771 [Aplosporella prunicola CBS 121167]KAF2139339.1 hypothetical protein K452DRAFT_310771 [Aplosporella prunicola CBS 121167]
MGIPRLLHNLEPYATPVVLGAPAKPAQQAKEQGKPAKRVVIDGPGLAYHAYHRAVGRRQRARNALEAMPPYAEVCDVALEFVDALEAAGLEIAAIFFDGLLPAAKRDTRLKRLDAYLKQLIEFHGSHSAGSAVAPQRVSAEDDIFAARPLSVKMRALPALPFLVPAVIERLQRSRHGSVTRVVAAEADAFCAAAVKRDGGWLLTSDSDLLVHDLGPAGAVVLFRDINRILLPGRAQLKAVEYCPARIAQTLGLPTLAPLAFALLQDPFRSVKECVRVAKGLDAANPFYQKFLEEYVALDTLVAEAPPQPATALPSLLGSLDPRISEYIHQALPSLSPSPTDCNIYLPFLIDDPTRASAWRPASPLRHLAYSLLAHLTPHPEPQTIREFERRGPRVASADVELLEPAEAAEACRALVAALARGSDNDDGDGGRGQATRCLPRWRAIAAFWLADALAAGGERVPSREELAAVAAPLQRGVGAGAGGWASVHRRAQWEGVAYSLRMLRQCVGVVLAVAGDGGVGGGKEEEEIWSGVRAVQEALAGLPGVVDMWDAGGEGEEEEQQQQQKELVRAFPSAVHEAAEAEAAAFTAAEAKRRRKKRKRGGGGGGDASSAATRQQKAAPSNNMYSLLGES